MGVTFSVPWPDFSYHGLNSQYDYRTHRYKWVDTPWNTHGQLTEKPDNNVYKYISTYNTKICGHTHTQKKNNKKKKKKKKKEKKKL